MSNQIRLAVVGYGLVGRRHAKAISEASDATLAAIVEPNTDMRDEVTVSGASWFPDLESLFSYGGINGVVLATPTLLHAEHALLCIENKCPVLIEKPIAVTSTEATTIVSAATAANVPVLVGHHRRYNTIARAVKDKIEAGIIGDIRAVTANCWLYKPDQYFDKSPWRKRKGAGPISVNLVHDIDLLRYFCGEVETVQAQACPSIRGYENEDVAAAILRFQSGAIATVTVSDSVAAPWSWEMTASENPVYPSTSESCYLLGGSKGSISIPDLRVWSHEGEPDWWRPINVDTISVNQIDPLTAQMQHFANVIREVETPLVSGLEGLRTLQVIEAIQKAAELGQTVEVVTTDQLAGAAA